MAYTQTVTEALADSYLLATGKAVPPAITDAKGVKLLALLNHYSKQWGGDDWRSMRSTFSVAATVSATNTYLIPATVHHVSQQEGDYVRIEHTDGLSETDYDIVPINRLYEDGVTVGLTSSDRCAISGGNLVFNGTFASGDTQFGGTIKVPGYSIPTTLTQGTDVLQVDDPQWLTTRVAAEYVRNDRTRVQLFDSLMDEAKRLWDQMKMQEDSQIEEPYLAWSPLAGTD